MKITQDSFDWVIEGIRIPKHSENIKEDLVNEFNNNLKELQRFSNEEPISLNRFNDYGSVFASYIDRLKVIKDAVREIDEIDKNRKRVLRREI